MPIVRIMQAAIVSLFCLTLSSAGMAASGAWNTNDHVDTRLVSATDAVGDADVLRLGLHFRMRPGWKIYWRSPGDAGFPPQPDWTGSENARQVTLAWPAPKRFTIFGLETLGYADEVLLPLDIALEAPGQPLRLRTSVRYLTCRDICIPYDAVLALDLPAGPAEPGSESGLIERFAAHVPGADSAAGLSIENAVLVNRGRDPVLQFALRSDTGFDTPDVFIEAPKDTLFGKPAVVEAESGRRAWLEVKGAGASAAELDGAEFTVTLVDGDRAIERVLPVRLGEPLADLPEITGAVAEAPPLWYILLLAVLGGLILNLMPCVLPVLSIKLLAAVSHGGSHAADVRTGFLATAAGIVASMLAIAAALIAVKAAGFAAGWGIQFQQPVFLAFMVIVVTLFACNLFGMFQISLPQWMSGLALSAGNRPSTGGHFLTGAFATLLATPCSAPFVGTAIGFALSRDAMEILTVFAALGLGLALPYLAVAAFPGVAAAMPRPGPWMITLRRVLGLALVATAVWLLSIMAAQIGMEGAILLGAMMALIGAVLALRRLPDSRLGRHSGVAVTVLALAALAMPMVRAPDPTVPARQVQAGWQAFDMAELRRIVAAGGTVFVDVTADWCITCQVNKKLVLDQGEVAAWLAGGGVTAMRADWTRPDPAIAAYLARFGRYGIPFNAIYGPKAPDGIALPELLTNAAVLDTAARASGGSDTVSR
ncbi:MAG: protein-disulfide reductase DsbD domain-containing protein [Alphaproteobacteria bacterium]